MASDKRRHKDAKLDRARQTPASGPPRQKDGDRRRRVGLTADKGMADKMARLMPSGFINRPSTAE